MTSIRAEPAPARQNWPIQFFAWTVAIAFLFATGTAPEAPAVFPDEVCRLGWARWFSGTGPHYWMGASAYCQPTWPLVIAPLYWLINSPENLMAGIFFVNSALAAACLPMAHHLAYRHFSMSRTAAWLPGIAMLGYPAITLHSHHAWPETALYPALLLVFITFCRWIDQPDWRRFIWLIGTTLLLYALHRKMILLPVSVATGLLAALIYLRSPEHRMRILLSLLTIAGTFYFLEWARIESMQTFWQSGDVALARRLQVQTPWHLIHSIAGHGAGSLLYGALATGGLLWLVLSRFTVVFGRCARECVVRTALTAEKSELKFLVAGGTILLLLAVSAFFFSHSTRFDSWFYGRHIDAALAVALVPAISYIWNKKFGKVDVIIGLTIAVACLALVALSLPGPPWPDYSPVHVIGAGSLMDWLYLADERATLLKSLALIFLLTLPAVVAVTAGRWRLLGLVPFLGISVFTHITTEPFRDPPRNQTIPPELELVLEDPNCYIEWDPRIRERMAVHQIWRIQFHFPNCRFSYEADDPCLVTNRFQVIRQPSPECEHPVNTIPFPPELVLIAPHSESNDTDI